MFSLDFDDDWTKFPACTVSSKICCHGLLSLKIHEVAVLYIFFIYIHLKAL